MRSHRFLLQGGHVLTLGPEHGELLSGDVLVDGTRIAAIGHSLEVPADCEVFDVTSQIVLPGFVDTHRHTWQTAMRALGADFTGPMASIRKHSWTSAGVP
jgi:5-methylthioadenosine/S-adenosylhomocysteine deaminase